MRRWIIALWVLSLTVMIGGMPIHAQDEAVPDTLMSITVENVTELQLVARLRGHNTVMNAFAFSPDGRLMATSDINESTRVWDTATGEVIYTLLEHGTPHFNADGTRLLLTGAVGGGVLWDMATGARLWSAETLSRAAAFTVGGARIAGTSFDVREDDVLRFFDTATGELIQVVRPNPVGFLGGVSSPPDGAVVSAVVGNNTVITWDASTGESLDAFSVPRGDGRAAIYDARYSPSGRYLGMVIHSELLLRDVESREIVTRLDHGLDPELPRSLVIGFTIHPDETLAATYRCTAETVRGLDCPEGTIYLWDIRTPGEYSTPLHSITLSTDGPWGLLPVQAHFSPDGRWLAVTYSNREALLYAVLPKGACTVSTNGTANLRSGAGTGFAARGVITAGDNQLVISQTTGADGFVWWELYGGSWVRSDIVDESGDCQAVAITR